MPVDKALLDSAAEARSRMEELERESALARNEFHDAVCRLHRAGASLREIADVLDLSHQRVHQIVGGTGGGVWARLRSRRGPSPRTPGTCSFCGVSQFDTRAMIGGPGSVRICDGCVALAGRAGAEGAPHVGERSTFEPIVHDDARCTFCGRGARRVAWMVAGPAGTGTICEGCIRLCNEVVAETPSR